MTVELTADQRLVKRGRTVIAIGAGVMFAIAFALFGVALVTERISDVGALVAFAALAVVFEAGAITWALWLLLSGRDGQEASVTRRNEALRLLVVSLRLFVLLIGLAAFIAAQDHRRSPLLLVVYVVALAVAAAFGFVESAMRRRYPVLPKDRPTWAPQNPIASWAGWYPDPDDRRLMRYFDGARWTDAVHDPAAPAR
jgi:hypothetical protein